MSIECNDQSLSSRPAGSQDLHSRQQQRRHYYAALRHARSAERNARQSGVVSARHLWALASVVKLLESGLRRAESLHDL